MLQVNCVRNGKYVYFASVELRLLYYQIPSRKMPRRKKLQIRDRLMAAGLTVPEKMQYESEVSPQCGANGANEFIERYIVHYWMTKAVLHKILFTPSKETQLCCGTFFGVQSSSSLRGVSSFCKNDTQKSRDTFHPLNPTKTRLPQHSRFEADSSLKNSNFFKILAGFHGL